MKRRKNPFLLFLLSLFFVALAIDLWGTTEGLFLLAGGIVFAVIRFKLYPYFFEVLKLCFRLIVLIFEAVFWLLKGIVSLFRLIVGLPPLRKKKLQSETENVAVKDHRHWLKPVQKWLFKRRFRRAFAFKVRKLHTLCIGQSGSGKSELIKLFILFDLYFRSALFLLEPHGDLSGECSRLALFRKPKYADKLVYLVCRVSQ